MSWVKLDDQFPNHPKVLKAGGAAAWLYVAGLCYSQAHLTDGIIPAVAVPRLIDYDSLASLNPLSRQYVATLRRVVQELCTSLVDHGLWELVPGGYRIHDYHDYNSTAESVRTRREATREKIAKWRDSKRETPPSNPVTPTVTDKPCNPVTPPVTQARPEGPVTGLQIDPLTANRLPLTANLLEEPSASPPASGQITWLSPYCDIWSETYATLPNHGRLAKVIRPAHEQAEAAGEVEKVAVAFRNFLAEYRGADSRYLKLDNFTTLWTQWVQPGDRPKNNNGVKRIGPRGVGEANMETVHRLAKEFIR